MRGVFKSSQFSSTSIQVTIFVIDAGAVFLSAFLSKITVSLSVFISNTTSASVSNNELKDADELIAKTPIKIDMQIKTEISFFKINHPLEKSLQKL